MNNDDRTSLAIKLAFGAAAFKAGIPADVRDKALNFMYFLRETFPRNANYLNKNEQDAAISACQAFSKTKGL